MLTEHCDEEALGPLERSRVSISNPNHQVQPRVRLQASNRMLSLVLAALSTCHITVSTMGAAAWMAGKHWKPSIPRYIFPHSNYLLK